MLNSLKGLLNVSKNVSLSNGSHASENVSVVDVNGGGSILKHYQEQWAQLHELNESNTKSATELAEKIASVHSKLEKEHNNAVQIVQLLSTAPSLKNAVENCAKQVSYLHNSFQLTEKSLLTLEDLLETLELQQRKMEHRHQLALYKQTKLVNMEQVRSSLAMRHAKKVVDHELNQTKILQERQQVFQEAFESDIETYKQMGTIPKIQNSTKQPTAILEEIQLECDIDELNQFFS